MESCCDAGALSDFSSFARLHISNIWLKSWLQFEWFMDILGKLENMDGPRDPCFIRSVAVDARRKSSFKQMNQNEKYACECRLMPFDGPRIAHILTHGVCAVKILWQMLEHFPAFSHSYVRVLRIQRTTTSNISSRTQWEYVAHRLIVDIIQTKCAHYVG